ncbi:MAG: hypothetical protein IH840_17570 [Candidatus Heimdallarchaeota archaeon]|nr:hypothetical protein [Candidatus Heimdallarchaeota archaeon]
MKTFVPSGVVNLGIDQGLLFSDLQITRATLLYSEYREEEIVPDQPMSDFVQCIKNLPAELMSKPPET